MNKPIDRSYLVRMGLVPVFGRTKEGRICTYWHKKRQCVRIGGRWLRKMDFALARLGTVEVCRRLAEAGINADTFQKTEETPALIEKYNALLDLLVEAARLINGETTDANEES